MIVTIHKIYIPKKPHNYPDKMRKKYVALYIQGRKIPCGAMRESHAEEVVRDLKAELGGSYELKPITRKEYVQINRDISEGHEGLENLISRYEK